MPAGRPSKYSESLAAEICTRITQGESVRTLSKDDSMPSMNTIFVWLGKYPEFREQYARAKEEQIDALMEEILDIADDGTNDWMERLGEEDMPIGWQLNGEHIQRSRIRIDTRKWLASKLKPKKYGDKLDIDAHVSGTVNFQMNVKD